ncbi:F-box protein CPR30-like [Chenopodium quinoa]|uniref:F-box protein CPR30-like n=1 Tax=Chenopodium quinoa TaxID=63459 RepID=UPI000B76CD04|nr:F-box protein CPR30-like [Chenopodium quinoa]
MEKLLRILEEMLKKRKNSNVKKHLPDEIIAQQILPRLPIKSLIRCKLVSKQWGRNVNFILDHIISLESVFIQSHHDFYLYFSINLNIDDTENNMVRLNPNLEGEGMLYNMNIVGEIELVGSSNGLVCLGENNARYFYLYNPITNQSHKFYPGDFNFWNSCTSGPTTFWGFGYVSSIDDFKVVRIILSYQNRRFCIAHVYSLKSNIWSKVECCIQIDDTITGRAYLVNETLYWGLI